MSIYGLHEEDKKGYFYANTRVRAMIPELLTEADYEKLLKMDINEMLRFLEEGEYKKEIDVVGIKAVKIEQLEGVLNDNFANAIKRIIVFAPKNSPLYYYVMRYDIANVKTILRSKGTKWKKEDIWQKISPAGTFDREFLKDLANVQTREQVIENLKKTPYYKVLKEAEKKGQEEIEDALDKFYFKIMLKVTANNKKLVKLIKTEIDVRNIFTLLRLKKTKMQNIEKYLIAGGNISVKRVLELSRLNEFEIINSFKGSKFWRYVPTNTKELDKIEAGLRKHILINGWSLKKDYSPSPNALFGYVFGKEREVANIRILARSKTAKNPEDALNIRSRLYVK